MKLKRVTIDTKDIMHLTGRSIRHARRIMQSIRKKLGKERYQLISIYELSEHLSLPLEQAITQLNLHDPRPPN